jgi:hypothetical protein
LNRRLCGPHRRYGRCGEEKKHDLAGNRTPAVQPLAHRYTDWATPASLGGNIKKQKKIIKVCEGWIVKYPEEGGSRVLKAVKFIQQAHSATSQKTVMHKYNCNKNVSPWDTIRKRSLFSVSHNTELHFYCFSWWIVSKKERTPSQPKSALCSESIRYLKLVATNLPPSLPFYTKGLHVAELEETW